VCVCVCSLSYSACNVHMSVACLPLPYFPTLSHKEHDFLIKVIEHKMCVLIFCTTFVQTFLIVRRNKRDMIKNVCRSACVYSTAVIADFNEILATVRRKIIKY
jgi:hypothetical protein